jgi:IclR family KDG regulon transcriptional repressor
MSNVRNGGTTGEFAVPVAGGTTREVVVSAGRSDGNVQAVVMALRIIETLAASPGEVGLTELARMLGTTKTRVFRHLRTLVRCGYVAQDLVTEKYRSGSALIALGQAASDNLDVLALARPVMRRLREQLGHTVMLSLLQDDAMTVVEVMAAELAPRRGRVLELNSTAQGKVAMAFGPEHLLERVLREPSARLPQTRYTLTRVRDVRGAVVAVRKQGWATAPQEGRLGLNTLAAPIFDKRRAYLGTLSLLDLIDVLPATPKKAQVTALVTAAGEISAALGYRA